MRLLGSVVRVWSWVCGGNLGAGGARPSLSPGIRGPKGRPLARAGRPGGGSGGVVGADLHLGRPPMRNDSAIRFLLPTWCKPTPGVGANLHLGVYLPLRLHFSIAPSVLCGSQGWRKPTPAHPFPEAGADLHLESLLSAAGADLHLQGVHGPAVWMERLGLRPLYTLFPFFACRVPRP